MGLLFNVRLGAKYRRGIELWEFRGLRDGPADLTASRQTNWPFKCLHHDSETILIQSHCDLPFLVVSQ